MHAIKDLRHERVKTPRKVSPAKLFNIKDSQKLKHCITNLLKEIAQIKSYAAIKEY